MNDSFALLTGFSQAEILKRDYSFLLGRAPEGTKRHHPVHGRSAAGVLSYQLHALNQDRSAPSGRRNTVPMAGKAGFLFFLFRKSRIRASRCSRRTKL
jgi:hypothetical protein